MLMFISSWALFAVMLMPFTILIVIGDCYFSYHRQWYIDNAFSNFCVTGGLLSGLGGLFATIVHHL